MSCKAAEPFTADDGLTAFFLISTVGEIAALLQRARKECSQSAIFLDFPTSGLISKFAMKGRERVSRFGNLRRRLE